MYVSVGFPVKLQDRSFLLLLGHKDVKLEP